MSSPGLSPEEVRHIASLSRVGVSEEDVEKLRHELSNILENFQVLQQVDTAGIPPTGHSVALENVMRDDEPRPPYPSEEVLANAPLREEDFFRVKAVLE